jgi:hypothetical protein
VIVAGGQQSVLVLVADRPPVPWNLALKADGWLRSDLE